MLWARGVWGGWYVRTRVCNVWLCTVLEGPFFMHCLWIVRYISDVSSRKLTAAVTILIGVVSWKFAPTDYRWQSRRWSARDLGVSGAVRGTDYGWQSRRWAARDLGVSGAVRGTDYRWQSRRWSPRDLGVSGAVRGDVNSQFLCNRPKTSNISSIV